ncbi:hypothetical protein ETZ94_14150 [Acinetobacter baumannii]|nr:hypothetical protein ETZ94_14150 [Acinetobacter baumannii]
MLKTIVEFKFDDYQLYDQNLSAEDGNTLVQKTEDIAQYIYRANSNMRCDSFKSHMIINKLSKFL